MPDTKDEAACCVIPRPIKVERREGCFTLTPDTTISVEPATEAIGEYLAAQLRAATGLPLPVGTGEHGAIALRTCAAPELGDEGYRLEVTSQGVTLAAPKPAGLFYGVQTLLQLLPAPVSTSGRVAPSIPAVQISDKPRFPWRGLLLDCCRHFRSVAFIKRYLDLLAYHKLNVFHWHLTEDQGWRIEIKQYPRLTEIGAWRDTRATGSLAVGCPCLDHHGGFYTQDDVREIVAYAASRFVTVMPEIEMPGHSTAALAAHPELSCTGGPFQVATKWGVHKEILCAGNDACFAFVENVLDEVLTLFPSQFIHVGGDEVPKDRWRACPRCKKRIRDEKLKDEAELQSYFMRRVDGYLTAKGRRLVGWDEILEGGLAPGATVMSWRGMDGAIAAARLGHDVICTPNTHCYLDWPLTITPLEKSYSFEPVPAEFDGEQARRVLGLQGNMWSEWYPLDGDIDRQTFPRLCALAEVAWSPRATPPNGGETHGQPTARLPVAHPIRDFAEFSRRLETHRSRLRQMGVDYSGVGPGQLVGHWYPEQLSAQPRNLTWDVSFFIRPEPGNYEVTLTHEAGCGATVEWAAVLEDGVELVRDTHPALVGAQARDNVYRFSLPKCKPGFAGYTLSLRLRAEGNSGSRGSLWWQRTE